MVPRNAPDRSIHAHEHFHGTNGVLIRILKPTAFRSPTSPEHYNRPLPPAAISTLGVIAMLIPSNRFVGSNSLHRTRRLGAISDIVAVWQAAILAFVDISVPGMGLRSL